ncbi:MAG TPA: ATP-binding protein [Solirubrobacterales bacterium]|nr:ATP-binding protein [Solirubrobacterales bacterium]
MLTQVVLIGAVLAATIYGGLRSIEGSKVLKERTSDLLLVRGIQQEFDRARLALREYVNTGDEIKLGPFTTSRGQIILISANLSADLDQESRERLRVFVDGISDYLVKYGDRVAMRVASDDSAGARRILNGEDVVGSLRRTNDAGIALQASLAERQVAAQNSVRNRQYTNVGLIALAGLLILAGGIGMLLWIRREMMLPLDDLAYASRKLGHGDLTVRVDPRGVDELAVAAGAFNQMAEEIEQHVQQLHDASVSRSRFVSSVSHELRTPITSLRGYLEMLVNGEVGELDEEQRRYIEIAERNARQLDELINDLLTLSRIQSGRISLKPEPVDVRALLRELKAEMMPIAAEKDVDLVLVDTGDLFVSGDPLRLKQAFGNLMSNAIKYSPDGQAVVVRAFRLNRQVVVSVVDWGHGIPKDELPKIAEPFFRSSTTERIPGTGLGLAIAKQMIELHGGRLAVESEYGAGSTFTAYLPLRAESADENREPSPAPEGFKSETPATPANFEPAEENGAASPSVTNGSLESDTAAAAESDSEEPESGARVGGS